MTAGLGDDWDLIYLDAAYEKAGSLLLAFTPYLAHKGAFKAISLVWHVIRHVQKPRH